jgi:hypothetical protein
MFHDTSYATVLAASQRAAWQIEDVIGQDAALDFTHPFLPEMLARTEATAGWLSAAERKTLNHIRGHEYLSLFGLVEEFILPFVLDHARPLLSYDSVQTRALLNFASEEAKHIELFKQFHAIFVRDFGDVCATIGPAEEIAAEISRHDPLAVALAVLQIEWMTQAHYVESVRDNCDIDPLFKSLLRHHWIEEAQHARLDTIMVEALADGRDQASVITAFDGYLEIVAFLDAGLKAQAGMNIDALCTCLERPLSDDIRSALIAQQHQAARWTFLGSGMRHPKFRATLARISPAACVRLDAASPTFS